MFGIHKPLPKHKRIFFLPILHNKGNGREKEIIVPLDMYISLIRSQANMPSVKENPLNLNGSIVTFINSFQFDKFICRIL